MTTNVLDLQRRLLALGFNPGTPDGIAGPRTKAAVRLFQISEGLTADGIAGPKTWERLRAKENAPQDSGAPFYMGTGAKLSAADFARLAASHGIEEAKIRAVNEVEAAGSGFYASGAVKCLYEPHIAWKMTSGKVRDALAAEGLAYAKWKAGAYPATSFVRIDLCTKIAGAEVAALSTSWGLGQIMGFNHEACSYPTAVAMVKDFALSEANQLEGMIRFIKANPAMFAALQRGDWAGFASRYNGPGYAANNYDSKLAAAYARHKKGA
ncbi:N-acetylmuramidase domain-containing protein [Rhizobium sp. GN54]|uniref:N-acetylmuramidase domain-containing protein n=1 Tax=Rhizobium sp. GN54 TaxID=2898150 RepID=UPI001E60402B|nr:N-acetylmuramidase family protein [Rhizobium sp. GN54]MCD2184198.1 N-acetylmuramidase family protein [Rhizobium sp. GN54]